MADLESGKYAVAKFVGGVYTNGWDLYINGKNMGNYPIGFPSEDNTKRQLEVALSDAKEYGCDGIVFKCK